MIIGISGKAGSGKDTVAEMLQDCSSGKFKSIAFADKLREICSLLTGIPVRKWSEREFKDRPNTLLKMTGREYLVKVGMGLRKVNPKIFLEALENNLEGGAIETAPGAQDYLITDTRMRNEADFIRQELKGYVIRVNRPGLSTGESATETDLDHYPHFHLMIENDGTLHDLRRKVESAYHFLKTHEETFEASKCCGEWDEYNSCKCAQDTWKVYAKDVLGQ